MTCNGTVEASGQGVDGNSFVNIKVEHSEAFTAGEMIMTVSVAVVSVAVTGAYPENLSFAFKKPEVAIDSRKTY